MVYNTELSVKNDIQIEPLSDAVLEQYPDAFPLGSCSFVACSPCPPDTQ